MARTPIGQVRLPKPTPPAMPISPVAPPSADTPPPLPAVRPTPPAQPAVKPVEQPLAPTIKAPPTAPLHAFGRQSAYVQNQCAISLWACAQVACQYGISKTSLTQATANTLDLPLTATAGMTLAEKRYEVATQSCVDDRPPPPPAFGQVYAEGRHTAEFYLDFNNWFEWVSPSPATNWGAVGSGLAAATVAGVLVAWYAGNDLIPVVGQTAGLNDDAFIAPAWAQMVSGLQTAWSAF